MKQEKYATNRKSLNKGVRKKNKIKGLDLTRDQYDNILISDISYYRICNFYNLNVDFKFFDDLILNKIPKYNSWYFLLSSNNTIRKPMSYKKQKAKSKKQKEKSKKNNIV